MGAVMIPAGILAKLADAGIRLPPGRLRMESLGDSPELSTELIDLIRCGPKRATAALHWAMEHDGDPMPVAGDIEIIVDHRNEPALVTRTVSVVVVPFREVTAAFAAQEGEGDGSLAHWREGHWQFFSRECARIGRRPTDDMPVVCTVFELLFTVPQPGG